MWQQSCKILNKIIKTEIEAVPSVSDDYLKINKVFKFKNKDRFNKKSNPQIDITPDAITVAGLKLAQTRTGTTSEGSFTRYMDLIYVGAKY